MSRHENSNQFKDGLLMDLHPLQTPNTVLTDNLNGTFITYNGNEYSLQNDMGNFKLKNCRLNPTYFPIGTASYADTIYILSYSPVEQKIEIGSYPSPVTYSETNSENYKKFKTISESYLDQKLASGQVLNDIQVKLTDLQQHKQTVTFDGSDFRLKGGDKYALKMADELIKNEFEELEFKVIFDSGKPQKIKKFNIDGSPTDVNWKSPGNIQLSSRIFDITEVNCSIINMYYVQNACKLRVRKDLFIDDLEFVSKIKNNKITLEESDNYIDLKIKESNSNDYVYKIETRKSQWLGESLKISFIIDFELPFDDNGLEINYNFEITPRFHTKIKFNSDQKNPQEKSCIIEVDSKCSLLQQTIDPNKNPFKSIGDKIFQWNIDSENKLTFYADGYNIGDGGTVYYYVHKCMDVNDDGIEYYNLEYNNEWEEAKYNDSKGWYEGTIESVDPNIFYLVILAPVESGIDDTVIDTYLRQPNNPFIKVLFSANLANIADEKQRYDEIPFKDVVKAIYSHDLSVTKTTESELNQELFTIEDLKTEASSKLNKYFKRFVDKDIDFPSFVKISEIPSQGTEQVYTYKEINPEYTLSFDDEKQGICKYFDDATIAYIDKYKGIISGKEAKAYCSFGSSIYVNNDFFFADGVKYYQMKFSPFTAEKNLTGKNGRSFYAITADKSGSKDGNFFIEGAFYDWHGSGDYWPNFKSLDAFNWKAIRMWSPLVTNGSKETYNTEGMCQMDFADSNFGQHLGEVGLAAPGAMIWDAASGAQVKSIPGMCKYVSKFHEKIWEELNSNWHLPTKKTNGNKGEYETEGFQAAEIMLCARTLYRDKSQRPSFTNDSFSFNLAPQWNKWSKRGPDNAANRNKGMDNHQTLLAFPLDLGKDENGNDIKATRTIDREYWWKVSGSEQHNNPEITGYETFDPIGLTGPLRDPNEYRSGSDSNEISPLRLYVAWTDEEGKKFERYGSTSINLGDLIEKKDTVKFVGALKINDKIRNIQKEITKIISFNEIPEILKTQNEQLVICTEECPIDVNFNEQDINNLKEKYEANVESDYDEAKEHPIFRYTMSSKPSARIQNYPIAGIYPHKSTPVDSAFSTGIGFDAYKNFKVTTEGRVFLCNLQSKDDIYIRKNSNKKVFGYFPYLPNCEEWMLS